MILLAYGTRPEYIKIVPLLTKFDGVIPYQTLRTGQHIDMVPKDADYHINIPVDNNRLHTINSVILKRAVEIFGDCEPDYVLVVGDTNSSLAIATAAFYQGIKVIHLEAGLRTYDLAHPFPEEFNRQAISRLASIHLCPTFGNARNLYLEKCGGRSVLVGNTVLDNLINLKPYYGDEVLVTMHRRENHNSLHFWFDQFSLVAQDHKELNFVLPLHPNPNVQAQKSHLKNIKVVEPLNYDDMKSLLERCRFIITDSGGLQEEGSFLNKKIIICRKVTERPECLGTHGVLCTAPHQLRNIVNAVTRDYKIALPCPFGDGNSASKILNVLRSVFDV